VDNTILRQVPLNLAPVPGLGFFSSMPARQSQKFLMTLRAATSAPRRWAP